MNSNSTPIDLFVSRTFAHGILLTQTSTPAFAVPLVRPNKKSNLDYTPTVDAFGMIDGFMPVEAQGKILTVQDNFSVEIGQEEIFGLIDPDGKPLIGTKNRFSRTLNSGSGKLMILFVSSICHCFVILRKFPLHSGRRFLPIK